MIPFRKQQTNFPEGPSGHARSTHTALSAFGMDMLLAGSDRRVRVYRRDTVEDDFYHAANFDDQVGKGFITDVSITDNGRFGLVGDEDGRLVAFTTQVPLIAREIETDTEWGHVVSCSISLNYVLASFSDRKRKRSRMTLWKRQQQTLAEGFSIVKTWNHDDIGDDYERIFRCCTVRNDLRNDRIAASIAYWTNRKLFYVQRVDDAGRGNENSQAFSRPPVSCRIAMVDRNTFVYVAGDDGTLVRLHPQAQVPLSVLNQWNADGVPFNQTLSMSALLIQQGELNATLAIISKDQELETYITI